MNRRTTLILTWLSILVLLGGGGYFFWQSGLFHALQSPEELQAYLEAHTSNAYLIFFLIQFLSVVLAPIPSNISATVGGLLLGTWPAFFLTFGAVVLGSILVFVLARNLGAAVVGRWVDGHLSEKYRSLLQNKADIFLILAFLFPFFPDDVLCILAGLSPIPTGRFVVILLLTRPWGLLFASALGGASLNLPPWAMILLVLAGIGLFFAGMKYGDKIEAAILRKLERKK